MPIDNLIIDGTNIEFIIFYVAMKYVKTPDNNLDSNSEINPSFNEQADITFRFLNTYLRLIDTFKPKRIYATWDRKLQRHSTNFRKDILKGQYKAGRVRHPNIQELYDQEIKLIDLLENLGVVNMFPNTLESDDVCAWLSLNLKGTTVIVSADHDLLQLITPNVSVYNLQFLTTYNNFFEKKQIAPELFLLYKAIKGDNSDNIDGLDGYGEVKSRRLANNWENSNITPEQRLLVERNIRLMDLRKGFKIQEGEEQKYIEQIDYTKNISCNFDKFKELCVKYNYNTIIKNIDKWKSILNPVDKISELVSRLSAIEGD